jgi:hypothetical protein
LYDKTPRAPKAGSLREAVFLAVWLKRQEAEAYQARIFAQGFYDLTVAMQGKSNVDDAFKLFVEALFPFRDAKKEAKDAEMKEMLKRQASRGPITFKPVANDFLRERARRVTVPEDFARKLAEKRKGST